uniref:Tubulin epsilon 1 n=1 Tax=Oncorhynchus tshawytscha TaxID=74940 RepID=A0A8C8FQU0_ONCTS
FTRSLCSAVGQCGDQVGCRLWDLALRKHSYVNKVSKLFLKNNCSGVGRHGGVEEGMVNEILQGPHARCLTALSSSLTCPLNRSDLLNWPFLLFYFQSLAGIVNKIKHMPHGGKVGSVIKKDTAIVSGQGGVSGAENAMNNVVANLLLNITSSARFEGSLNMDLNDMDLVPFPRLYYLVPSVTPLYTLADVNFPTGRSALLLDQMFTDASSKDQYLACALRFRTPYLFSLLLHLRLRPTLPFVSWNQEGWKTGLCSMPPVDHSLLALTNNTCAHLHHYLFVDRMMEQGCFTGPISSLSSVIEDYSQLDATKDRLMPDAARLNIAT